MNKQTNKDITEQKKCQREREREKKKRLLFFD